MRALRRGFAKFQNLLFRGRAERELAREIAAHLTLLQDEFERRGIDPDEAALAARHAYGGIEQAKELHRDERSILWIEQSVQDLHHAWRGLARNPGFTCIAVIALALGIGVDSSLFTTYNAIALKPLPVADPDHVVRFERWVASRNLGAFQYGFSYPEFVYARSHSQSFSSLVAASGIVTLPVTTELAAKPDAGELVSANYFAGLGIDPVIGRGFLPDEDRSPGGNAVVVISYRFWKLRFHGDETVAGQTLSLNGKAFTVIGVAPEEFTGTPESPAAVDFWAPLSMQAQLIPGRDWPNQPDQKDLQIFARLKPSADRAAARAQTEVLIRQFAGTYVENDPTTAVTLQRTTYFPNTDDIRFRVLVAALMLIVGLVLFAACANVGNMLLARGAVRTREVSTRIALGAGRGRLIRQLLTESVLLSCLGGLAGLVLSIWLARLLGVALQQNASLIGGDFSSVNLSPDFRVLLYVIAVSLAAGICCGLWPALRFTKPPRATGHTGSPLRSFLVGSQVAVSALLLAVAGLLARGLIRAQIAEPGFRTRDVFLVSGNAAEGNAGLLEQLREQTGIVDFALGTVPLAGTWTPPIVAGVSRGRTLGSYASDTYFETLGIPVVRGRTFTSQEVSGGAKVAVISESTARQFFPAGDPLGKFVTLDMDFRGKLMDFEVVGIVKDVRFANLSRLDPAHVYLPSSLSGRGPSLNILARVRADSALTLTNLATTMNAHMLSLDQTVQIQRSMPQSLAMLAAILAGLALSLAGVGIYGVIAFLVSQRTREIGVRMALGASSWNVWKNVIATGMQPVFIGIVTGLTVAGGLSSVLHQTLVFPGSMDFLYGVPFYDPGTFGGLVCFILAIATIASAVPARRALRVDPAMALHYE